MPAQTFGTTFNQVINQHGALIAKILEEEVSTTPQQFADQVESLSHLLAQGAGFAREQEYVDAARHYLFDALTAEDVVSRAVLLGKANEHLDGLDPTDFA